MQDRFKFRAWIKAEKRYGYLLNLFNCGANSRYEVEEYDEPGDHYTVYSADEVVLQQCTGLKDKNGKLIFEGDIVQCNNDKSDLYKVEYDEFYPVDYENEEAINLSSIGFHFSKIKLKNIDKMLPFSLDLQLNDGLIKHCGMEIIGNIYENPELLEAKGGENKACLCKLSRCRKNSKEN